jgi:lysozyme family protein
MMDSIFDIALRSALSLEGGYTNNPNDPGGPTNKGITQHLYDFYRASHLLFPQSVASISLAEATEIYRLYFWNIYSCSLMPAKLAVAFFDTVINMSPKEAIMILQMALNVTADGILGPITKHLIQVANETIAVAAFIKILRGFYLGKNTVFMQGWLDRCDNIEKYIDGIN